MLVFLLGKIMSTIPTQNPVPSESPKDLKFNSGKIDEFVTSNNHFYTDRFGKKHYTIDGINYLSKQAMQNYGYITKKSFESGNTIINPNDVLLWESNGEYYRWDGELPKVVSAGSTPESAGGIGDGKWKSIGDASLRQDLLSSDGTSLIMHNESLLSSIISDLDKKNPDNSMINANDHYVISNDMTSLIDIMGIIHTGQSLAEGGVGYDSCPIIQSSLNCNSYTLSGGPVGITSKDLGGRLNNFNETVRSTIASTLCDKLINNSIADKVVFSGQAWGGKAYKDIKKGGSTGVYEKCITQVSDVIKNKPLTKYKAITIIHGEQDGVENNTSYANNLSSWVYDFNNDIKSITKEKANISAYICQTASAGGYGYNGGITELSFPTPVEQLKAHKTDPLITLVTSKYHLKYADHAHITNSSQGFLGEYYAKAVSYQEITGEKFEPCRPIEFIKNNNTITIKFIGYEDALVIDTDLVNEIDNYGFSYKDSSGNKIISVSIVDNDVVIQLSGNPSSDAILSYAYHNGLGGAINQKNGYGDRGNIRGSSKTISKVNGEKLHPWCVIFREKI